MVVIVLYTLAAPTLRQWLFGRWTFAMTHLYLFFAEFGMKSATTGVIVVHRPVVQTLNIAS
jgi:hypothetical protein